MGSRDSPPFRAEHIGSLLRPPQLRRAFRDLGANRISPEQFRQVQDKYIRQVVSMQEETGLKCVTDGEFRRTSYWSHLVEAVDGLGVQAARFKFRDDHGNQTEFLAPHVEARISRSKSFSADEIGFLLSATSRTAKLTIPSPSTMHFWDNQQFIQKGIYSSGDAYFQDLARVYQEEIALVTSLGVTYIQFDEVPLAMLCDSDIRNSLADNGEDPDELIGKYIALSNDCFQGHGQQVTIGVHLCRGNFQGRWLSQGDYDRVAERMFNELNADVFLLEYDTPRAGGFSPLRYLPDAKSVVLGLVSSKLPQLEDIDNLRRRIDEAARYVPLDRLGISPQCGFASAVTGNPVTPEDQAAKLRLVVETAESVWQ